jgi:hypothetical protein
MSKIEVDFDVLTPIVVAALKDDYKIMKNEIDTYAKKISEYKELSDIDIRNLVDATKIFEGIKTVLAYYMTQSEYKEFVDVA